MKSLRKLAEILRAAKLSGFSSLRFPLLLASVLGAGALIFSSTASTRSQQPSDLISIPPPTPAPFMPPRGIAGFGGAKQGFSTYIRRPLPLTAPPILPGAWFPVGPAPIQNGQEGNIKDYPGDPLTENEASGAINTVASQPGNADVIYVGTVNGGVWKTTNGTASNPVWTPLTDNQESASIRVIKFDPTDATHQTVIAGIGDTSSFGELGGPLTGLLRTTDGGAHWSAIDGGGTLISESISGVVARGNTIIFSTDNNWVFQTCSKLGIFRSTDGGTTFSQISGAGGTGLPGGIAYDLAEDPNNNAILYTAVTFASAASGCGGGVDGIYKSSDTGATWTKVSDATIDALLVNPPSGMATASVKMAVGNSNNVFVTIMNNGTPPFQYLAGFFRSGDGGATWQSLDTMFEDPNSGAGTTTFPHSPPILAMPIWFTLEALVSRCSASMRPRVPAPKLNL